MCMRWSYNTIVVAQRERVWLITRRTVDRNYSTINCSKEHPPFIKIIIKILIIFCYLFDVNKAPILSPINRFVTHFWALLKGVVKGYWE